MVTFLSPEKILKQIDIKHGMKVADFGCGTGYFSVLAGKLIGSEGRVYAIDVLDSALSAVKSNARIDNVLNIETIRGNLEVFGGSKLPDNSCDIVLLVSILFQSQKKSDIIKEAKRVLKPNGKLVLVDWDLSKGTGPKDAYPLKKSEAKDLVQKEGLIFKNDLDAGAYHFGLIFEKKINYEI